jgi:hypothetical protein
MLWGCFSTAGTGRLVRNRGKWTEQSTEVIDENLLQGAQDLRLDWRFTFQQDNDPKHTSLTTLKWLRDKSLKVNEWSSQSPDMKQIKPLWRPKNCCAATYPLQPARAYRCVMLVASYPIRLKAVTAAKGASTKYWVNGLNTYVNVMFQFVLFF